MDSNYTKETPYEGNPITQQELYDKIHGEQVNFIVYQTSAAHNFGNVTAFVENWLLNLFPKDLFKTVHVNSKIAHNQMRSTGHEILKKHPPMFILRPRIDWTDDNRFMAHTPIMERMGDLYYKRGYTNLQEFFYDRKHSISIKYQMNRAVINFDVILIFQTLIQELNWANFFLNAVRQEIPFNLETCLESYISPELLHQLSVISGIPMADASGSVDTFLRYLNANSMYPVTLKLQGNTQTNEFFRYYPVKIDTIVTNFTTDEGEKIGHVSDRYMMTFSLRCEFNTTGFYYLFSDKLNLPNTIISVSDKTGTIIPVYTDVMAKEDIDLPIGWQLYNSPSCRLEKANDIVNIKPLLNNSIVFAFEYHKAHHVPFSEFFKLRVRKQGMLLQPGKDYDYNPDTYEIQFYNNDRKDLYYTYKILIMLNVEYINNLIKKEYHLK